MRYTPAEIEPKWQQAWDEAKAFKTPTTLEELGSKPKFYVLDMFPYPSGAGLHVGHPEGYTATDVVARLKRMRGFNVLHPMGWDAFGLPAERAAMRDGIHPAVITKRNTDNFRRQIKRLGFSYDWDREVDTSAVDYYRWTQWIFLQLHKKDLAYLAEVPVNWCPAQGTVLANEEVKDGKYVETGDPVERKTMKQWMLKIPLYGQRLLDDLEGLDWPEGVKEMQRNWIGRSEGAEVSFVVDGSSDDAAPTSFKVFTTRPDTLFGATYCVLAPEHPLVHTITTVAHKDEVAADVHTASQKTDLARTDLAGKDKTGVFTGAYAINPATKKTIPIWVADYVLSTYGTGAIMAVPAHDERDHAFAKTMGLPIVQVVQPAHPSRSCTPTTAKSSPSTKPTCRSRCRRSMSTSPRVMVGRRLDVPAKRGCACSCPMVGWPRANSTRCRSGRVRVGIICATSTQRTPLNRGASSSKTTGCRSTSTSAVSSTRCCICSTRGSGTRCCLTVVWSRRRSRFKSSSIKA